MANPTVSRRNFIQSIVVGDLPTEAVTLTGTQTLTNKTLTLPIVATISNSGTITLPTGTRTLVARDTTDTLTNKTITAPIISTISNTGTLTLPTSTDTLVGRDTTDTLTNKTLTAPKIATILTNAGAATVTLPTSTDTLVGKATTDTLTNKSLTSPTITGTLTATGLITNTHVSGSAAIDVDKLSKSTSGYALFTTGSANAFRKMLTADGSTHAFGTRKTSSQSITSHATNYTAIVQTMDFNNFDTYPSGSSAALTDNDSKIYLRAAGTWIIFWSHGFNTTTGNPNFVLWKDGSVSGVQSVRGYYVQSGGVTGEVYSSLVVTSGTTSYVEVLARQNSGGAIDAGEFGVTAVIFGVFVGGS